MEVNSPKRYLLVEGSGVYGVWTWAFLGRVGQAVSLHKMGYANSKNARPLANLLVDELGKECTLQRVHPDACECGPGPAGQHLLSALGLRQSVCWGPCD